MRRLFSSDHHFRHRRIIEYSRRPFKNVNHMNEELIIRWNSKVQPDDEVYHLGDFGFGWVDDLQPIFDRLNGKKFLIPGNHDKESVKLKGWEWIKPYHELYDNNSFVCLFHYACRVWNKSHHSSIALYGHSHGSMPGNSQSLDVGVDCWDYYPVSMGEIKKRLATLPKYVGYREQAGGSDHHIPKED